ncbi:MAG: hypothetical protein Q4G33_09395 [bacterium]|nr:hypothetical protein [bacterium]
MLINEAVERADRLVENEYSLEEKYHWCDVVSGELKSQYAREYKKARLHRWKDNKFLLPQDCEYRYIEKIIFGGHEINKEDMRTFGFEGTHIGNTAVLCFPVRMRLPLLGASDTAEVVYLPVHRPIRRIALSGEMVTIPSGSGKRCTIRMNEACPFIAGDTAELTYGDTKAELHILKRTADFDEDSLKLCYILEYGEGEADALPSGEIKADIRRIVTDKTVCGPPYDEMYIDYICAQICFFQRKHDIYSQFISRYNERMEEYGRMMMEFANEKDRTVFSNWWRL